MTSPSDERYRLVRRLGSGAFGTVYLALDVFLDQEVAVKMPLREHPELLEFLREPRLLHRVRSPAIVELRDIERIQGVLCLVMEYVPGGSLRERIGRPGAGTPLPAPFAVRAARRVASALEVAHRAGVLHRDIKPDNVLLDPEGQAKVTDFGIARVVEALGGIDHTMHPGGTLVYMSPEALAGECSPASDLWATAILLYESLSGRLPLSPGGTSLIVKQIESGALVPIEAQSPGVDPELAAFLGRALSRERERRFPDAAAFGGELERIAARLGEPEKLPPPNLASFSGPSPFAATDETRGGADGPHSPFESVAAGSPARSTDVLAEAGKLEEDGRVEEAKDALLLALARNPGSGALHRALGLLHRRRGEDGPAFDELERAFLLDRTDRTAAEGLAELGLRLRRPERTAEALAALSAQEPANATYARRLAMAEAQLDRRERAIRAAKRSLELDPEQPRLRRMLARWESGAPLQAPE